MRRVIRGIALMFLIYTAMYLASPGLCRGESLGDGRLGSVAVARATRLSSARIARVEAADNQPTNEPAEQPSDDDDCFCCCSHVIPGTVVAGVDVSDLRSPTPLLESLLVPSPPLARTFHPPRFA